MRQADAFAARTELARAERSLDEVALPTCIGFDLV
jgi:hypothetical protein